MHQKQGCKSSSSVKEALSAGPAGERWDGLLTKGDGTGLQEAETVLAEWSCRENPGPGVSTWALVPLLSDPC